jgi:cytochrome c-type biogenesis protein CcmH
MLDDDSLLSRLRYSSWVFGQDLRGTAGTLILAAAAFLLVAGIGAVTSYVGDPPEATGSGDTISFSLPHSGSNGEMLARLTDYTRSIGIEEPASMAAAGKLLPDVNTMIERLTARLETTPEDIKGWRMLGWSYFHTARYKQAATAYARAVELDPNSAELKLSYEEARAKASERDNLETANPRPSARVVTDQASRKKPSPKRGLHAGMTL